MMSSSSVTDSPEALLGRIVYQVEKVIVGKRDVIEKLLVALLAGGHVLLEDVPGVGKTMLVRAWRVRSIAGLHAFNVRPTCCLGFDGGIDL